MAEHHHFVREDGSVIDVAWTDRADGDFHIDASPHALAQRRQGVMAGSWAVVRQVHGNAVVGASDALASSELLEADGIVTSVSDQPIAVQGADCAPVALITNRGPIGVAHAGWRGLACGIVESLANALGARSNQLGERVVIDRAVVGPVICPACYEFGETDLARVVDALGESVRASTRTGTPALDMRAGLVSAFDAVGVSTVDFVGGCPACEETGFSHRGRSDTERHCLVARLVSGSLTS